VEAVGINTELRCLLTRHGYPATCFNSQASILLKQFLLEVVGKIDHDYEASTSDYDCY
jgi:hypothetical protein